MTKLGHGRAPNYRLREAFQELEQGTFVRPVEFRHLPIHISKELPYGFDVILDVVCYTPKGFKTIPRKFLEET